MGGSVGPASALAVTAETASELGVLVGAMVWTVVDDFSVVVLVSVAVVSDFFSEVVVVSAA